MAKKSGNFIRQCKKMATQNLRFAHILSIIESYSSIFENGKFIGKTRDIREIRDYCAAQIDTLWDEVTRFENPHDYYVDLSQKLWEEKNRLLENHKTR